MNDNHEPCPVCGRQPEQMTYAPFRYGCTHGDDMYGPGYLVGPYKDTGFDAPGSKWDEMCRAIRALALRQPNTEPAPKPSCLTCYHRRLDGEEDHWCANYACSLNNDALARGLTCDEHKPEDGK